MAAETARARRLPRRQVLVASTGVIGVELSIDKIRAACRPRSRRSASDQGPLAARAIMTTDPFPKEAAVAAVASAAARSSIGGMAKGSGMIEPMMATMLGFVTTDAAVPQPLLDRALREVVDDTFNAITVDGECSTNDCVMLLANGASGVTDRRRAATTLFVARASDRLPAAGARHRARRRRRDQAHHRHRDRRGVGRRGAPAPRRRSPTRRW